MHLGRRRQDPKAWRGVRGGRREDTTSPWGQGMFSRNRRHVTWALRTGRLWQTQTTGTNRSWEPYVCEEGREGALRQGSLTPGPWMGTSPQPVRNWAAKQELSDGRAGEASFPALHHSRYRLYHLPHSHPWKNCLPRNRSLVPKRLGTAVLEDSWVWIPALPLTAL